MNTKRLIFTEVKHNIASFKSHSYHHTFLLLLDELTAIVQNYYIFKTSVFGGSPWFNSFILLMCPQARHSILAAPGLCQATTIFYLTGGEQVVYSSGLWNSQSFK